MTRADFLVAFKQVTPETQIPQALAALRQDRLVWESLQDAAFQARALEYASGRPERWNPAALALLALEAQVDLDDLRASPTKSVSADLRRRAGHAYEEMLRAPTAPATLAQAGLIALALRERRRVRADWDGLTDEIDCTSDDCRAWRTVLACLYAMVADPIELFRSLLPPSGTAASAGWIDAVLNALLSNPAPTDDHSAVLTSLLKGRPPIEQAPWLDGLAACGREDLAAHVATGLHAAGPELHKTGKSTPAAARMKASAAWDQVAAWQAAAELLARAGELTQAADCFQQALQAAIDGQAGLALRLAAAADAAHQPEKALAAWEQAAALAPDSDAIRAGLALAKSAAGAPDALAGLPPRLTSLPALAAATRLALKSGDASRARTYAKSAARAYLAGADAAHEDALTAFDGHPSGWISALLDLDLVTEAIQVGEVAFSRMPNDLRLAEALRQAYRQHGELEKAVEAAHLAVLFQPAGIDNRRALAGLLEAQADWPQALEEREKIVDLSPSPEAGDWLALAACALQADQPGRAAGACGIVLKAQPENGLAHALMGEAQAAEGREEDAMGHFTQAILLAPEQATPWLFLARAQERAGDHQKSLETLRAAAHAAPGSAEVHLALAEACLSGGAPSEALPALRKAAQLDPRAANIALKLGATLVELGHLGEARQAFERGRQGNPTHPELAYAHGKTLLALGEPEAALVAFETALDAQPEVIAPYIDYAATLLSCLQKRAAQASLRDAFGATPAPVAGREAANAQALLEKGLALDPQNLEARLLQAELLLARGEYAAAHERFSALSEETRAHTSPSAWRIGLGLGQSALTLRETDTALAALQDAALNKPDALAIYKALTEAYYTANLTDDALQAAYTVQRLAPHDPQVLAWFARAAIAIGAHSEAVAALQTAAQLDPERADVLVFLGQVQMQAGDSISAKQTFLAVLKSTQATPRELQDAAHALASLDDLPAAVACLERAVNESAQPPVDLLSQLAQMLQKRGDLPGALEIIQRASQSHPDNAELFLLQADFLAQMKRTQAALACLQQAAQVLAHGATDASDADGSGDVRRYLDLQIRARFARWLRALGDPAGAYTHALAALDLFPNLVDAHYYAGELAVAMLDVDGQRRILDWTFPANAFTAPSSGTEPFLALPDLPGMTASMLCLQAEVALAAGDAEKLSALAEQIERLPISPRVMAAQARLKLRQGERKMAEQLVRTTLAALEPPSEAPAQATDEFSLAIVPVALAALDLGLWQDALALFGQAVEMRPMEPRTHLDLARALILMAEAQRSSQDFQIRAHAPGENVLDEAHFQAFEKAILAAGRLSASKEAARWQARGLVAFKPEPGHIAALLTLPRSSEDSAALMAALRRTGDPAALPVAAGDAIADPRIQAQLALSVLDEDPQKALAYVLASLAGAPEPRCLALAAFAAERCGDLPAAGEAITKALALWPDEPRWHALAGRIAAQGEDRAAAIDHFRQALNLEPGSLEHALSLGQTYLEESAAQPAIQALALAVRLAPEEPEPWMALARAHLLAGDPNQALTCADRAAALAPTHIEPLVLKGELALHAGKLEEAALQAGTALALSPDHSGAILLNAHLLLETGHTAEALEALERAVPFVADPQALLLEQARLIYQAQGASAALNKLNTLVSQYPDSPEGAEMLANALADAGQREAAQRAAQTALQLQPENPRMHFLLGRLLRAGGQLDQAIHHLSEVLQSDPHQIDACLELGRAYQERREHASALKVYQQAIKIAPHDPRPYYQAGLALRETKDYRGAESMLRRAADLAPDDVNIRRQLGAIIAINLVHNPQEANSLS